ncbi:MAG: metalloregulator ArsR/SmtB family transcription factor [Myxococcota bacterium]|nr:winged helix-turn-helix transcriptional regulator [Deltaproteobacteria bacterium]MDQ3335271.1 metalloregulator ArsR/SmtB family transcription factor [Myxococcota bacterium]
MDDVAQALADPIRRDILRMLRERPTSAGAIAGAFDVSRPAVSRHLRVLREAGLVRDELHGRERLYQLELSALVELEAFLQELRETVETTWERRFMALETEVFRVRQNRRRQPQPASDETKKKETA